MKARIYIDKGTPLFASEPETLSDGSVVWNIHIRGGDVIGCLSEKAADQAINLIGQALTIAAGEKPLVL